MFWITLGLALALYWVALEGHWQAQGAKQRAETLEVRQTLNFQWLKSQNPVKHVINMRPTVAVDYKKGVDVGADWNDDLLKTQTLAEQDSGFRLKQS